jgi:NitT/TauT family transport system permease protein
MTSVAGRAWLERLWAGVPLVLFVLVWQLLPSLGIVDPAFLPSATEVWRAAVELGRDPSFFADLGITFARSLLGLALGAAIGVPLGAWMAVSRPVEGFFNPLLKATYSLPKTSLVPLLILWLGIGTATNVVAVMLSTLLPLVVYSYHGVQGTPKILLWSARAMGTSERDLLRLVMLPSAMHGILTGLRIALGFSFVIAIAAEMIAANAGIGKLMFIYGENGAYAYMFAAVGAVVITAYVADTAIAKLTDYLLRWQEPIEQTA